MDDGVAHMDLKSANIIINASLERLYIIDLAWPTRSTTQRIQSLDSEGQSSGLHQKSKTMAMRTA